MKHRILWTIAILVALGLSVQPWAWQLETFRTHSQPAVFAALCALPVLLAIAAWVTHRFRVPRWEPVLLLGVPLLLCFARLPLPALLGTALFLSAHAIGFYLLRNPPESALLRVSLRFGLGAGVIILITFTAGLLGLLSIPLALVLLAPALSSWPLWEEGKAIHRAWMETENLLHPCVSLAIPFALAFGIAAALWAITPAITYDPLKMHLANARWYVEMGSLVPSPASPPSYYPQGAELLMALLWTLGGQAAAQFVSPVFFVATLLLAAAILRACALSRAAVICGVVAAASIPFLHWTGSVAKNDTPLAFFILASLACLIGKRPVLASFFLAMAFGIKHVALFGAVALTPLFLWEIWQSKKRVRVFLAVAGVFLLFGLISLLRTYLLTGDPLYPESLQRTTDISVITHPYQTQFERIWRYAGIPWLLHFDGYRAFESASPNPMGLWLVFFFLGWLGCIRDGNRALRLTLLFCAVYLVYWVSILVTLRYAFAPLLLLTALTAPALFRLPRRVAPALAVYCLSFSLLVCILNEVSANQILWLARRVNDDTLLRRMLPYYPAARSLFGKADPGDQIFSLDGCPAPYAPHPGTVRCFDQNDFQNSLPGINNQIRSVRYRFLILPQAPVRSAIMSGFRSPELIFEDAHTAVFEVKAPCGCTLKGNRCHYGASL